MFKKLWDEKGYFYKGGKDRGRDGLGGMGGYGYGYGLWGEGGGAGVGLWRHVNRGCRRWQRLRLPRLSATQLNKYPKKKKKEKIADEQLILFFSEF